VSQTTSPTALCLMEEHEGGLVGGHQGRRTEGCVPSHHLHPVEGALKAALKVALPEVP
jgi:hypothetical protein